MVNIQKALNCLENADFAGYFDEMDNAEFPNIQLKGSYAELKGTFIGGNIPWNFFQKLETFAKELLREMNKPKNSTNPQNPADLQNLTSVLLVGSNPAGKDDLKLLTSEMSFIQQHCRNFYTDIIRQPTAEDLQDKFPLARKNEPVFDVVHFSGHGNAAGVYVYDMQRRKPQLLGTSAFKALFGIEEKPKVVILNACSSAELTESIKNIIPFVVGTNASLTENAAIAFSNAFYRALSGGHDAKIAFLEGRRASTMSGASEDLFVLYQNGNLV